MSKTQTVYSKGILHGLPTFPDHDGKRYSIIVTGANGISGAPVVKLLSEAPERWNNIYALSRRPAATSRGSRVKSLEVDFLNSRPEEIAKTLTKNNVEADYVFFASYVQPAPKDGQAVWSDAEKLLLSNFLSALTIASIAPKRILLQYGAKYYGLQYGPTRTPMEESDPRITSEPNFYYGQDDILRAYCAKNGVEWVTTSPNFILGAVKEAAMNITYSLSLYAAIQKHLGRPLAFPSDIASWETEKHQSFNELIAYHAEWALLTPEAGNEFLNVGNGDVFCWGKFWSHLANWYGIDFTTPNPDLTAYGSVEMPFDAPRGFGPRGKVYTTFTFLDWSKKAEVVRAWEELKMKHGLVQSPFNKAAETFGLLDNEILGGWPRSLSMNKSRNLGWHGFVDTKKAIRYVIRGLAELKMVPPLEFGFGVDVEEA